MFIKLNQGESVTVGVAGTTIVIIGAKDGIVVTPPRTCSEGFSAKLNGKTETLLPNKALTVTSN